MRLLSIELAGFKSFARRTRIRFETGVTAIVGPNGCGKSNIVDAIKWVLGTLSTKAMRADEMADVVFHGAPGHPPTGFAEVTLTFDNSDQQLPIAHAEVCVSRRLDRSGHSEFTINSQPCRLRDIRDLFAGTGIGPDTYAMIEQGKIERFILANPTDLKAVFDEAAGISRYRLRRREAQLRLQRVEQDLLRANDVLAEVQRELHALRVQAGRAAKYRQILEELRGKSIRLLLAECLDQEHLQEEAARQKAEHQAARDRTRTALDAAEQRAHTACEERHARQLDRERLRDEAQRLAERLQELHHAAERATERAQSASADAQRAREERTSVRTQAAALTERLGTARREHQQQAERRATLEQQLHEAEERATQARHECEQLSEEIEQRRTEVVDLARTETAHRNEAASLERELEATGAHAERLEGRIRAFEQAAAALEARIAERAGQVEQLDADLACLAHEREDAEELTLALEERRAAMEGEIARRAAEIQRLESRRQTIAEWEAHREALGSGSRSILDGPAGVPSGVLGAVAEFVEVEWEHAAAVGAALGEAASFLLVADLRTALDLAAATQARGLGRAGLLPLLDGTPPEPPRPAYNGVLGSALDLVRCRPEHRPALARLLASTLVVRTLEDARVLRESGLWSGAIVTLDGVRVGAEGSVVTPGGAEAAGPVARRAERRRIDQELELLHRQAEDRRAEADRLRHELAESRRRAERARIETYERSVRRHELQTELEQLRERRRLTEEERDTARQELAEQATLLQALQTRLRRHQALAAEAHAIVERHECALTERAELLRRYEESRRALEEEAGRLRLDHARAIEAVQARAREVGLLEQQACEIKDRCAAAEQAVECLEQRLAEARQESDRANQERRHMEERRGTVEARLAEAHKALHAAQEEEQRASQERAALAELLASQERALHELELRQHEARARRDQLAERVRHEFGVALEEARRSCPEATPEERQALRAEVASLQARKDRFGAVNMLALERLGEVEEREWTLRAQRDDLVESQRKLLDLIAELNREAQARFDETLQRVADHFDDLFRRLFGGGKTQIKVVPKDGADPSDWGVEIFVHVPGKQVTKLSLLSGGEKSLTAVALALALFRANPAPFCILDEADSALDDVNVERFAALVCECAAATQFIVVTHNKKTMAAADLLYGVSMEEPGVSKLVSVDFRQAVPAAP